MATVVNMPGANVTVRLPSGTVKTVNMLRLLAQTQNAEFKVKHGMFLPGVGKQHPTVKAIRDEYEIPVTFCRTWKDAAILLRQLYTDLCEHIALSTGD
jgi:hypothetical protein